MSTSNSKYKNINSLFSESTDVNHPALQFQVPALPFVCVLFVLFLLFVVILSGEPKQKLGRGLVNQKLVQAPSNLIAGRPKAPLLFWYFSDFRCGVSLFSLYINIEIGKNRY